MPKSTHVFSATSYGKQSPTNPSSSRASDVALRKKKNADAQAAFRARRANYIATLEETVTNLEYVVLQLQESRREAKDENRTLEQENSRLQQELEKREKFWRKLWKAKKAGQDVDPDDPARNSTAVPLSTPVDSQNTPQPSSRYDTMTTVSYSYGDASMVHSNPYGHYDSSMPYYSAGEADPNFISEGSASSNHRRSRFSPYPYSVQVVQREASWSSVTGYGVSPDEEDMTAVPHASHSQSPHFVESVVVSTHGELTYPSNDQPDDERGSLSGLDAAPYMFSTSPSLSPPPSSAVSSAYSFDTANSIPDHTSDYDYRRQQPPEIALHGGATNVPLIDSSTIIDAPRYRLGSHLLVTGMPTIPTLPPLGPTRLHDYSSQARAGFAPRSRSSSPGAPAISGTLSVIKAQAFGALRRTRTRAKKSSDGAAKVAMDLEARDMGMGGPHQRSQYSDDEDLD